MGTLSCLPRSLEAKLKFSTARQELSEQERGEREAAREAATSALCAALPKTNAKTAMP